MRLWVSLLVMLGMLAPAHAQEALPPALLKQLKDTTVFVRVRGADVRGQLVEAGGSGFLIHRRNDVGHIATNVHVVTGNDRLAGSITVVFDGGTDQERSLAATVAGRDDECDLAILRVEGAHLPRPLDLAPIAELRETLPVFLIGYPFGRALALDRPNPAVTVSHGTVSSLRRDRDGELALIQLSGDINPGNSGGPVVDAKGALVGVAVAKVGGTQIGLAIAADTLRRMLSGGVRRVSFERAASRDSRARFTVRAELLDPLEKLRDLAVLVVPASRVKDNAARKDGGPVARNMKEFKLKVDRSEATGDVFVSVEGKKPTTFLYQVRCTDASGKTRHTDPVEWKVEPEEMRPNKDDAPKPGAVETPPQRSAESRPTPATEPAPGGDWLGDAEQERKRQALAAGEPVETGTALLGEQKMVLDGTLTALNVEGPNIRPDLLWSEDAGFLYVLEQRGVVRKIAVPTFIEQRQFLINQPCAALGRSAEGLVVLVNGLQELWLFDPALLTVKARIPVAGAKSVCTAPALSLAYLGTDNRELLLADLRQGEVLSRAPISKYAKQKDELVRGPKPGTGPQEFELAALTPDGHYLFCVSNGTLHRLRVQGTDLVYEERSAVLGPPKRLEISPDSRYIAMRANENDAPAGHPSVGRVGVYIFKTTDLQVPVTSLTPSLNWLALGFDRAAAQVYTASYDGKLSTYTPRGLPEKLYSVDDTAGFPIQILVHPQGRKLLLLSQRRLTWIELPP